MVTFSHYRIGTRFSALLVIFFLGFALFGAAAFHTLDRLKVNGALYQRIVQTKDLVADILPPPEYILESYLVCLQLARATEPAAQSQLVERLKGLRKDYLARHEFWAQARLDAPLAGLLLDTANQPVEAFYRTAFDDLAPAIQHGDKAAAEAAMGRLEAAYEVHRAAIDQVVEIANRRAVADEAEARESNESATWTMGAIFAASLGASLLLVALITRSVVGPVGDAVRVARTFASGDLRQAVHPQGRDETAQLMGALGEMRDSLSDLVHRVRNSSETVAHASAEIAHGNADLSARTESQASSLQQAAASMEQLGSTVRHNADNASEASLLAQTAAGVAVQGGRVVAEVVATMRDIHGASQRIADITGVIDGIAFQTNILALNAAVEAARAGEEGRGFAVVAAEVRSLATRSAEAAKQIRGLIEDSVERVEKGAGLADRAGQAMGEVVGEIQRVAHIVGEISVASSEQSTGVSQLGLAIHQLDRVTQQNSALVEEMAAAASGLSGQAAELVRMVTTFKLADGGAGQPGLAR
ncbi:methyl-accepting chemotaxis protein [Roseateles sp.]|uniref:methyl-accepting chemotaxis protein n=1 Tax=Roseateles sp. TaxID=1971397 RepID=UPI002E062F88|nr:methyl-accepting chemotaxis protein [Roseateles sp.]HEV6964146.1 methyl-accepting chemotaxis protein [Roseateles sp.]